LLLLTVQIPTGDAGHPLRTLQIAFDTSTDQALLADYRLTLLTVLGLGLIFAVVVGRWLARKGAQPLVEITRSAQHITASQLQERIAVSGWPTELAELAGAFNAMLDRLEDSFARLSRLSGDLAHELRTPIGNLRCQVEVALSRERKPQEYQQILASSLEEYERLSRMVEGLLFIARADNPKTAVKRVRFDARREIEAVREFYEALASEHEVEVVCEGQGELTGDPVLFGRAISNVLANALHHTPSNGSVCITICPPRDETVEIRVRDTGVGMAGEHVPKVFDRFYRADPSRAQARGGTGLGLAIVQSILRLHGGKASIESQLGQGTTVILRFPAGEMAPPDAKMATM
jgi:two-component system heavy metal sensor histidine kinase CusS